MSDLALEHGSTKARRKEVHDDFIMQTNASCIVSKRSVEKTYHAEDHGFLRNFVRKFQRRSPLINRGYWLRMRAVEQAVRSFISSHQDQSTYVVNLGCGFDTLPFSFLSKEPDLCHQTRFVDVDYKKLLEKKCETISSTDTLRSLCGEIRDDELSVNVLLSGTHYSAVSTDLQAANDLERLKQVLDVHDGPILFLAEVSMTYMEPEAANNVIKWASQFLQGTFVLLEQYLPDGKSNRFAETMLSHFTKLQSPLQCALKYPSLRDQQGRFLDHGWASVRAKSLWSFWSSDEEVSASERSALDKIEPFDEWEEFMLYAAHYFILRAEISPGLETPTEDSATFNAEKHTKDNVSPALFCKHQKSELKDRVLRRSGAGFFEAPNKIIFHGGHGIKGRLSDANIIVPSPVDSHSWNLNFLDHFQYETAFHTITRLKSGSHILVGGRVSPDAAIKACFLCSGSSWKRLNDLPRGRYRHSTVPWGEGVLVIGGKHDSTTLAEDWLYWQFGKGWSTVAFIGDKPPARFGACASELTTDFTQAPSHQPSAIICGGLGSDGRIIEDFWQIDLLFHTPEASPVVRCWQPTLGTSLSSELFRFGAIMAPQDDEVFAIGGVGANGNWSRTCEILRINNKFQVIANRLVSSADESLLNVLLIGHQASSVDQNSLVIYGGGGNCFSFGTFWNEGVITVNLGSDTCPTNTWGFIKPAADPEGGDNTGSRKLDQSTQRSVKQFHNDVRPQAVMERQVQSQSDFQEILTHRKPVVIRQVNLGKCLKIWSTRYLTESVGYDKEVTVHSSTTGQMSFLDKNFAYVKKPFGAFMNNIENGAKEYMRAIASSKPGEKATNFQEDFPAIADDFQLPPELSYVSSRAHSSPLRISGPVAMWLHYDVMANVLCQIKGRKRLLLFAPQDVSKLHFPPGASSSRLNPWTEDGNVSESLHDVTTFEANLDVGDVLCIPPLWAHTASPTDGWSIAVNVFFRDMDEGYAAGRDVYGNRDLQAYENGRKDVDRIVKSFKKLPSQCAQFYLQRLADELADAASARASNG